MMRSEDEPMEKETINLVKSIGDSFLSRNIFYYKDSTPILERIQMTPEYDKMLSRMNSAKPLLNEDSFLFDLHEVRDITQQIKSSQLEVLAALKQISVGNKGGESMNEELVQKVHSIDIRLTKTETIVQHISDKLDRMDAKLDSVATKDFVEKVVGKSEISTLKWIIGTGVGVAALVIGIIKLF